MNKPFARRVGEILNDSDGYSIGIKLQGYPSFHEWAKIGQDIIIDRTNQTQVILQGIHWVPNPFAKNKMSLFLVVSPKNQPNLIIKKPIEFFAIIQQ